MSFEKLIGQKKKLMTYSKVIVISIQPESVLNMYKSVYEQERSINGHAENVI